MSIRSLTLTLTVASALAVSLIAASAADKKSDKKVDTSKLPPAAAKQGVTYAADIKPIFEKTCFKCHGTEKQKGKLRLDSLEAVLKGSENGKILVPGKSVESVIVIAVARIGDEDDAMPPPDKGKPLTSDQVGLIRAWIDQGAK
jgi:mono/diheme cytochrome c family protein